jgi:anti-sigma B factor antagonist
MKSKTSQQGSVTVITLEGSLMGGPDASELNSRIHALLQQGKKKVVVDFRAVEFINSSGLGMLIGSASALNKAGGRLLIANASKKVLNIITITKLSSVLETGKSLQEAIATLSD